MNYKATVALSICALMGLITAISHMSCIFLGPECFKAQLAPSALIESSRNGTLLAPIATIIISFLFILCSAFSLSATGVIKKLPFTYYALGTLAILCTIRGIATIPLSLIFIEMVTTFSLVAGFIWFVVGLLYVYGFMQYHKKTHNKAI